jgi:hypothetical protein
MSVFMLQILYDDIYLEICISGEGRAAGACTLSDVHPAYRVGVMQLTVREINFVERRRYPWAGAERNELQSEAQFIDAGPRIVRVDEKPEKPVAQAPMPFATPTC